MAGVIVAATGFGLGYFQLGQVVAGRDRSQPAAPRLQRMSQELVLVYIGSSRCVPSNNPRLPPIIARLQVDLANRARAARVGFTSVGISKDYDVDAGIAHLRKVARFDEVITGRSWLNLGLWRYVYGDIPGLAATPQVIVTLRQVDLARPGAAIASEGVLARKVGVKEIEAALDVDLPRPGR